MARSTLFTLLVLALLQVALALPYGYNLIINVAANGALIGNPYKTPSLKENTEGVAFNRWGINPFKGGASIFMPPAGAFLNVRNRNEVVVRGGESEWSFEQAGSEEYIIKLPNEDLVLEWNEQYGDVSLQPANGESTQRWKVQSSFGYSRMFSQC